MRSPPERWGTASRRGWRSDAGSVPGPPGERGGGGSGGRGPAGQDGTVQEVRGRRREAEGGEGGDRRSGTGEEGSLRAGMEDLECW